MIAQNTGKVGGAFAIGIFVVFPEKLSPDGSCTIKSETAMGLRGLISLKEEYAHGTFFF